MRFAALLIAACVALAAPAELDRCNAALSRGDYAGAARDAQAYLRLHPASAPARVILARAQIGLNQPQSALNELRAALKTEPANTDALYFLSKLAEVLGQQQFMELARMAPDSARVHQLRGEGFAAQGKEDEAEKEFQAALERRPGTPAILVDLGDLKRHRMKYAEALEWYMQAIEKAPDNYDAVYGAGVCQLHLQTPDKGAGMFRAALRLDPASIAAKMALGESLLESGHTADSIPLLEEVAAYDPRLRRLQYLLLRAYKAEGRTADAARAQARYQELTEQEEEQIGNPEAQP
jgi:predicted Zn-dependent protease